MKQLKTIVVATMLAGASFAAQAVPLSSVAGPSQFKIIGATTEANTLAGTNESTWGIGNITSIQDTGGNTIWGSGESGSYLTYMIYGIADLSITAGGTFGTNIYNVGATGAGADGLIHLDVYQNSVAPATVLGANPLNRTGFGTFNGITNLAGSSLYLSLAFVPGFVVNDPATPQNEAISTLVQNVSSSTLPATGKGTFYAEVTGGSAAGKWDTNGFLGGVADLFGNFTLVPNTVFGSNTLQPFAGEINDPVYGTALPEPTSLALLGLGLAGLGALRRRKS